jgi:hypothetical protein
MRFDALDAPTQTRKRVRACADHAPLPGVGPSQVLSEVNPRLAHLFMICSNIKLTWPEESIVSENYVFRKQSQWDPRSPHAASVFSTSLIQYEVP